MIGDGPTLSGFFRIQRGIATGGDKFFILQRADAIKRSLPSQFLQPIQAGSDFTSHLLLRLLFRIQCEQLPAVDDFLCQLRLGIFHPDKVFH